MPGILTPPLSSPCVEGSLTEHGISVPFSWIEGQGADMEKLTHKDTFLLWASAQNSLMTVNSESLLETTVTSTTRHGQ